MSPTPERRSTQIAILVSFALFMDLLDGTVISTALPQMARSFHESPVDVSVGMTAYLLTLAVFIPISGWIADRYGARTVFSTAIVIFTLASMLCGLAQNLPEFIAARVLQGMGGALMVPVGRLAVLRNTDKRDLIRAQSLITTPALIAPVLGPAIGGFITTVASWRWIFYLNLPLGIALVILALLLLPRRGAVERRPFDGVGFVLSGTSLASLIYGIDLLGRGDTPWPLWIGCLAAGLGLGALTLRHARIHPHPLVDLTPLRIPSFATPMLWGGIGIRIVVGSSPLLWPLLFQVGLGMTPFQAGAIILTCAAGDVATKAFTTRIIRRFGFRAVLVRASVLLAAGTALFAFFTPATPVALMVLALVAVGICRSVAFTSLNTLGYADIPGPMMSSATALASTLQQLSLGIGIAYGALGLHAVAGLHGRSGGAFSLDDVHAAFLAVAVTALLGAWRFARLPADAGATVSGHTAQAA